ncbi:hypothetical protein B0I35DRAFT_479105 [Stachybotrys elegans]|uniref:Uncharacterized protein n=1 Tax=Stachybotrys elegans TaxID=80388 RepID=A0A8K0SVK8_9HYPO|nr:hypothetical protein B0I35DRAFT_479105 [Stachybotrys elegans]
MDSLDGFLLTPPDRNQILGRAVWKPRYVIVGRRSQSYRDQNHSQGLPSVTSSRSSASVPKPLTRISTEEYCISIYKSKDDAEPIHQWAINSVADCQVDVVAHRKQGPSLPTLIVTLADKEKKRRSSRAAGLISGKEPTNTSIWFRAAPDAPYPSLHDWARFISSKRGAIPNSPTASTFTTSTARRDFSDTFSPVNYSGRNDNRSLQHKNSINTQYTACRERPKTFSSTSASLRSKRSDISSPASSNYPIQQMGLATHMPQAIPMDLPSPSTVDYQGEFIEGWTTAQGRSSTVSSPLNGRDSLSSHALPSPMNQSSSPPAPRETILDRAFQMKFIPGSDREVPGEEKLSSLARFEALMREADEKRKEREAAEKAEVMAMRSAFDSGDTSEESDANTTDDSDSDDANFVHEHEEPRSPSLIPPTAQRALDFIASRHEPVRSPTSPRPIFPKGHLSQRADTFPLRSQPPPRPHTAHGKTRPVGGRSYSIPQPYEPAPSMDATLMGRRPSDGGLLRSNAEKRLSGSSTKRRTLTEGVAASAASSTYSLRPYHGI